MNADDDTDGEITRFIQKEQVTIPKKFRDESGLQEADELLWMKVKLESPSERRLAWLDEG